MPTLFILILKDDPFEEEKAPISSRSYLGIADGVNFGDYNSPSFGDCHERHFATKTQRETTNGNHFDEDSAMDNEVTSNDLIM